MEQFWFYRGIEKETCPAAPHALSFWLRCGTFAAVPDPGSLPRFNPALIPHHERVPVVHVRATQCHMCSGFCRTPHGVYLAYGALQSSLAALKILCSSLQLSHLPSRPLPTSALHHRFSFSGVPFSWDHTVCSLLRLAFISEECACVSVTR